MSLRQAICADLQERKGLKHSPDEIVVSNGAKQAVLQALLAIVSPGRQVIIPAPYWTSYPDMVKMCGGQPIAIQTLATENFALTPRALRLALDSHPNVSALIVCNPSNPTGCILSEPELAALGDVLLEYPNVIVICDEIYERLVYDSLTHTSFGLASPALQRTGRIVTINGFSKSHAMTGLRLGYSASSASMARQISKLQSQITSSASSVSQFAAARALLPGVKADLDRTWFPRVLGELQKKRDYAYEEICLMPGISVLKAQGAFYLLPDVSAHFGKTYLSPDGPKPVQSSVALCLLLLEYEQVALVPGEAFGADGHVRVSYATSELVLREAMRRMRRFLASLH